MGHRFCLLKYVTHSSRKTLLLCGDFRFLVNFHSQFCRFGLLQILFLVVVSSIFVDTYAITVILDFLFTHKTLHFSPFFVVIFAVFVDISTLLALLTTRNSLFLCVNPIFVVNLPVFVELDVFFFLFTTIFYYLYKKH